MTAMEVKRATDNLSCPVCYQIYKNPKYLPCYHSYCEECLKKIQVQSKVICPECRQEATIPAGGVKDLPNNFLINRLVDELLLKHKVEGEDEVQCELCDEDDPVVTFCPDCSVFLCHVCNEAHKRDKRSRGHGIVPLTELRSKKDVLIQAKPKVPMCKKHDIELLFYCETCEELVCMYCTMKDHAGHEHDTVKLMAWKHRNKLKRITAPVEEMATSLAEIHDNIEKIQAEIKNQGGAVVKTIDQHYDELVQKLWYQKEQLKQQAYDLVSQKVKKMMTQLEEVEHAQAEVLNMKELKDAVEESSNQEALSAKKQVVDRMKQLTSKYQKMNKKPIRPTAVEFVINKTSFPQFGYLSSGPLTFEIENLPIPIIMNRITKLTIIVKDGNGDHYLIGGSELSVQLEFCSGKVMTAQVKDNNDGSYVASFRAQQAGDVKLSVHVNGEHVTGSPCSAVVQHYYAIMGKSCKLVSNNGSMGKPWGIAFGKNSMWAVTDHTKSCVYIFNDENALIWTFGNPGKRNGQLSYPKGIAFDQDNHIYVADYSNRRLQKFNVEGNHLLTFGVKGSSASQLACPIGVTVHDDRVYVTDVSNKRISVFQTNGQFCFNITEQLNQPYDVAINGNNQLLVADYGNHCIYTFTLDGQYINKFGTQGLGQLRQPCNLTTDSNSYTIVSDTDHHRIVIFDSDGNYVHHFGHEGSGSSQFKRPRGIAVSANGDIYVSDSNNCRIQIFSM